MPDHLVGKRVWDDWGNDYGTIIDVDSRGRCLIRWDREPPNRPPYVKVPNHWCRFVEEAPRGARIDGDPHG